MRLRLVAALALVFGALLVATAGGQTPAPQPPQPPQPPQDTPDRSIRDGSAQRALDRARRRWRRARIHNYRFELTRSCFCPQSGSPILFVRGGRPVNPSPSLRHVATIRRLHRRVQDAIDDRVADLDVTYGRRGIPRGIGIDGHRMIADDEIAYSVERFWRGTRGRGGPDAPALPAGPGPIP
jgi:hypothetical protein